MNKVWCVYCNEYTIDSADYVDYVPGKICPNCAEYTIPPDAVPIMDGYASVPAIGETG